MTTGGLPGHFTGTAHCVYPASVVSRAPTHMVQPSLVLHHRQKLCSSLCRMKNLKNAKPAINSVCHSVNIYQPVN